MPSNKRCVFGCVTTGITIHSFPNPKKNIDIFNSWVTLAADYLKGMTTEEIHRKMKVCDKHFTHKLKNRNSRLNALAIPTLHLPFISVPNLVVDMEINSPSPSCPEIPTSDSVNEQHNINSSISNVPSASLQISEAVAAIRNDHDFCQQSLNTKSLIESDSRKSRGVLNIENYKSMKTEIKNLKREVLRLRKKKADLKNELQTAKKLTNSRCLETVTRKMTIPAKIFTNMQFRESHKKVKGHRFTTQEKILSLSLFQRSTQCYTMLSQYFIMPSATTLKNLQATLK